MLSILLWSLLLNVKTTVVLDNTLKIAVQFNLIFTLAQMIPNVLRKIKNISTMLINVQLDNTRLAMVYQMKLIKSAF